MNGQNTSLVSMNYYNPSQLFNRMGQLFYRTGEIGKAKMLFLLSGIYDGKFSLENDLYSLVNVKLHIQNCNLNFDSHLKPLFIKFYHFHIFFPFIVDFIRVLKYFERTF